MRLYSSKQLIIYLLVAIIVTALLTFVIVLAVRPDAGQPLAELSAADALQTGRTATGEPYNVAYTDPESAAGNEEFTIDEIENIEVYKQRNEGVVNITSISIGYTWFLEPVPQEKGTGSGSILDQQGHILTNYHVVEGADKLRVTLADGSDYDVKVIGVDPENDLAIVKFEPAGKLLTTIPLAQGDKIQVGQKVLAIGNPFGLERTLTTGIISAQRAIKSESGMIMQNAIQTDASINPGNSGGPLLNSRGEMIGINTMIYSPSGGSVGIGFAVPIGTARRIIPDLIKYGQVKRGWIEITPVQLFSSLVRYAKLPVSKGVLVSEIKPGGNAEKAGLKAGKEPVRVGRSIIYVGGDVITEVDGMAVAGYSDLYNALEDNKPGETVLIKIIRNGKPLSLEVKLVERPRQFTW